MSDSEILVRIENVSNKFCRSLKKSLWYGVTGPPLPDQTRRGSYTGVMMAVTRCAFGLVHIASLRFCNCANRMNLIDSYGKNHG